jgi:hypothetical protein
MSYTFLQEQGEESSAECFSDIPAYVLSRLNLTQEKSYCSDSGTESCPSSQFGTTSELLTEHRGEDAFTWCAVDFLAQTFLPLGPIAESMESNADLMGKALACGLKWKESLRKYNLDLCSLKTPRIYVLADCSESFKDLAAWGITQSGVCLDVANSARIITESACSSLPTPTSHNSKEGAYPAEFTRNTPTLAAQIGGKINPDWNEWRMGWPIKWTDLKPLETARFQAWRLSHGKF